MPTPERVEHFVTLFDGTFLPMGLCLHESLMRHAGAFRLWILCMDEEVEDHLGRLHLPNVSLISLRSVETGELLRVKPGRSKGEYCWTLTPFTPEFVFKRDSSIERVTYLDSDIFFFDQPRALLEEFEQSGKHILITEHAYDPEYDYTEQSGRYCVQFMTFRNTPGARVITRWWQERCIEWCFDRPDKGRFGDQKYLDDWPERFGDAVHVLRQVERTLAPWNVRYFEARDGSLSANFYHFHTFRILNRHVALLFHNFRIGPSGLRLYGDYVRCLRTVMRRLAALGIKTPGRALPPGIHSRRDLIDKWLSKRVAFRRI